MSWTDDPVRDAERHAAKQEEELKRLPRCSECGHRIQTDNCYEFDGELICPHCLMINHGRWVDDYVE